jgi:hypothetical protein
MVYEAEGLAVLQRHGRLAAQLGAERGRVNDLSRDEVIVCVGKPVGSISGWVGPLTWQVWIEPYHQPGEVNARIDRGLETLDWRFDSTLTAEALLEAAKDRIIPLAQERRLSRLAEARANMAQLEAVAS